MGHNLLEHIHGSNALQRNTTATALRARLVSLEAKKIQLEEELADLTELLREKCQHPIIISWPSHISGEDHHAQYHEERRICGFCTYEEIGDYGFQELKGLVNYVVRDANTFYAFRRIQPFETVKLLTPLVHGETHG